MTLVSENEEIAEACFYTIPRGGQRITGPSIRLAEILASAYKNLWTAARIIDQTPEYVVVEGMCVDAENNIAYQMPVVRRMVDTHGRPYNTDMRMMAIQAACSVAVRNVILRVIPRVYTEQVMTRARQVAAGKAETLPQRRQQIMQWFAKRGIDPQRVLQALNLKGIEDIGLDEIVELTGMANAIKEGTPIEVVFPPQEPEHNDKTVGVSATKKAVAKAVKKQEEPPLPPDDVEVIDGEPVPPALDL